MSLPTISTINNGESAGVIRQKLNENFASILSALGDRGLSWSGSYDNATQYQKGNVVYYGSALYIAKNDVIGLIPTNTSAWDFLLDGPQGIPGVVTADSLGVAIGAADDATPNDTDYIATSLTGGGILKKITWTNTKAFLKTYFDTLYAKYLGDADFYKYSIVTSVASGNLTVTLLNYLGATPSATAPVKIQIGGVIRTITYSIATTFLTAGTNWGNAGSTELATKEIDWFVYILDYNNSGAAFNLGISRYPLYNNLSEVPGGYTGEKYLMQAGNIGIENVVNIGRFNATLSAGGAYTWSIPATSVIINSPIYETRYPITSNWTPTLTWTGTTAPTGGTNLTYNYQIIGSKCYIRGSGYNMTAGLNNTRLVVSLPFGAIGTAANIALIPAQVSSSNVPNTCYGDINYNDNKLSITFATANVEYFNFQGYYNI